MGEETYRELCKLESCCGGPMFTKKQQDTNQNQFESLAIKEEGIRNILLFKEKKKEREMIDGV